MYHNKRWEWNLFLHRCGDGSWMETSLKSEMKQKRNKRYVLVSNIPALYVVEHIAKLCSSFQVSVYHIGKLQPLHSAGGE